MVRETFVRQLPHALFETDFARWLGPKVRGKARDNYLLDDRRVMIATDRVSAFDRQLGCIPFKGQLVTQMSLFWFELTRDIIANHVVASPHPNVIVAQECRVLPVEFVVRAYLTGVTPTSIWYQYARGNRVYCGHPLPEGLKKNDPLPEPILTPSTKAPVGSHDQSVAGDDLVSGGVIDENMFRTAGNTALAIFRRGQDVAAKHGIILVDTKYEFGIGTNGELLLIDEVHTPDSSRFWFKSTYSERYKAGLEQEEYDKEFIRLWLASQGFEGDGPVPEIPSDVFVDAALRYVHVYEAVSGKRFDAVAGDPRPGIADALRTNIGFVG